VDNTEIEVKPILNYQQTEYPDLFKKTNWGKLEYGPWYKHMVKFRNKFAETYKLRRHWHNFKQPKKCYRLDNLEVYRTFPKIVLIFSPPVKKESLEWMIKFLDKHSFIPTVKPLNRYKTKTYIKVFDTEAEFKVWRYSFDPGQPINK